jgi:hypothetical protein
MEATTERLRRIRGKMLQLVALNHEQQSTHLDDIHLWDLLEREGFDVSQNYVITRLEELEDRGYLRFEPERNDRTGERSLRHIKITASGRDVVERLSTDLAILIP